MVGKRAWRSLTPMPPSLRAFAVVCPYQTPRHDGVVGANHRESPGEGEGGIAAYPPYMIID
ncbi:MAG: hypothetical protein DRR16_11450 [Candidatus Parabeggiatoa sp. nov. 3]|nr:MAG: hypothetical protein DRR00_14745 [Gammaproteobacteria bacterium]RKZ66006.1 MAG: hypothetical protein DRQ99_11010 [Gammaproteobacteria bacterium]RKZ85711.1 MAG: hypothetical protein DRR16_11450 [Gammaproteobacteria bacterium]